MTTLRLDPWQRTPGEKTAPYGGPVWYEDPDKIHFDVEMDHVILDLVRNTKTLKDIDVAEIVVSGNVEQSMEGASFIKLTLHDEDYELLKSGIFDTAIDIKIDNLWWRLVAVDLEGTELSLTFEDRVVAWIKSHKRVRRASRASMTRLEFCLWLIRMVKQGEIKVVIPELHRKMAIERLSQSDQNAIELTRQNNRGQGLHSTEDLKVYYADGSKRKATKQQIKIMEDILDQAVQDEVPAKGMVAAITVAMIETGVKNKKGEDASTRRIEGPDSGDSQGVFQQRTSIYPLTRNVRKQAHYFFKGVGPENNKKIDGLMDIIDSDDTKDMSAGELAAEIQRPMLQYRDRYKKAEKYAQQVVDAYGGEAVTERTFRKRYMFSTADTSGHAQNYWDSIGSLMSEVQRERFVSNGVVYLISDKQLMKSKPRMILGPLTPGINTISFNCDGDKVEWSATINARMTRWVAPPGTVIKLKDLGVASGNWLVSTISRDLYSRDATITLKKPGKTLKEPAPEVATADLEETTAGEFEPGLGLPGKMAKMYREAKRIHDKHYPYVWGGGHASAGKADRGDHSDPGVGYDCSGFIAALLVAGGFYEKGAYVPTSDQLGAKFVDGPGKYFTIYANAGHVFAEFYKEGKHNEKHSIHVGTGDWGKGWSGAGINETLHPHAGFKASHIKGF